MRTPSKWPAEFDGFVSAYHRAFDVTDLKSLEVHVGCHVVVLPGDANGVEVDVDADAEGLSRTTVTRDGDTVSIRHHPGTSGPRKSGILSTLRGMFGTGGRPSTGRRVVQGDLVGGRAYVDGVEQVGDSDGWSRMPRIVVRGVGTCALELSVSGACDFRSEALHAVADVEASGSCTVVLNAVSARLEAAGECKASLSIQGGKVTLDVAGSCEIASEGSYSKVKVKASGSSKVTTRGPVAGDYVVEASGACTVVGDGSVGGSVRRDVSGAGDVRIG